MTTTNDLPTSTSISQHNQWAINADRSGSIAPPSNSIGQPEMKSGQETQILRNAMKSRSQEVGPTPPSTATTANRGGLRARCRRVATVAALALTTLVGFGAVSAAPASAANGYSTVTACAQTVGHWGYITAVGPYGGLGYPAYLDAYVDGGWVHMKSANPDRQGCLTFAVVNNYYWRISVNNNPYAGASYSALVTGNRDYNLGTFWV